jgi:hypothetical protein
VLALSFLHGAFSRIDSIRSVCAGRSVLVSFVLHGPVRAGFFFFHGPAPLVSKPQPNPLVENSNRIKINTKKRLLWVSGVNNPRLRNKCF